MVQSHPPSTAARLFARLRAREQVPALPTQVGPEPEQQHAWRSLALALRIGEQLLSGGAGAGDVTAAIARVTDAAGLLRCEADVTYTVITISYSRGEDEAPVTASRFVRRYGYDGTRLVGVHRVVEDLVAGTVDVVGAQERVDGLRRAPHPYPRWVATASWAGLAAAIAVLLGGAPVVVLTAFVATVVIDRTNRRLNGRQVPFFYQYVVGGAIATASAAVLALAGLPVNPSLVVAAGLVALLPGGLLVGSVQDALGGFLVTASARGLEVVLLVAGLLTGVALVLDLASAAGLMLELDPTAAPPTLAHVWVRVLAAAAAAALFALANYAPRTVVLGSALVGGLGFLVFDGLRLAGLATATATAGSAIAMGIGCHLLAQRVRLAPLLLLVPAIIPQLPGQTTFRAMLALSSGEPALGFSLALRALTIGLALAAGVLFGQLLAQPVTRDVRRLDRRRGPRLLPPALLQRRGRDR